MIKLKKIKLIKKKNVKNTLRLKSKQLVFKFRSVTDQTSGVIYWVENLYFLD